MQLSTAFFAASVFAVATAVGTVAAKADTFKAEVEADVSQELTFQLLQDMAYAGNTADICAFDTDEDKYASMVTIIMGSVQMYGDATSDQLAAGKARALREHATMVARFGEEDGRTVYCAAAMVLAMEAVPGVFTAESIQWVVPAVEAMLAEMDDAN